MNVNRINGSSSEKGGLGVGVYAGRSEAEAVCMLWRQGPGGGENREHNIMP